MAFSSPLRVMPNFLVSKCQESFYLTNANFSFLKKKKCTIYQYNISHTYTYMNHDVMHFANGPLSLVDHVARCFSLNITLYCKLKTLIFYCLKYDFVNLFVNMMKLFFFNKRFLLQFEIHLI